SPWISITPSFTAPPAPHFCLSALAISSSTAGRAAMPLTVVTVLPRRPCVSRRIFTTSRGFAPGLAVACAGFAASLGAAGGFATSRGPSGPTLKTIFSGSLRGIAIATDLRRSALARAAAQELAEHRSAQLRAVLGRIGRELQEGDAHLVGGLLAVRDALGRIAGVADVGGGVVVDGVQVDPGPLREADRRRVEVLALPAEVPVVDLDQRDDGAVGRGRLHLHRLAEVVHVRRDAVDGDGAGE